jgi:hypothetical protein
MSIDYSVALEISLAILLLIANSYCMRLDGKLKALRTGSTSKLEAALDLQQSVLHAEKAVVALRPSADSSGREHQARID